MAREMPKERKKRFTEAFIKGQARKEAPTFESKLTEAHHEFFSKAKARGLGQFTAEQTGARGLAERRREFFLREKLKDVRKRFFTKLGNKVI